MLKTDENGYFAGCLGELLRNIRKETIKVSQKKLGDLIGVSQVTISGVESGKILASVYLLFKYCEIAEIQPSHIVEQLEKMLNKDREML